MTSKNFMYAAVGAAIGSAVTAFAVKKHYHDIAEQEIESMRQAYNLRLAELSERNRNKPIPDIQELVNTVSSPEQDDAPVEEVNPFRTKYAASLEREATEEEVQTVVQTEPGPVLEAIGQEDFIAPNGYDKVTAIVYSDGIVATETDDEILEVDSTIGFDAVPRIIRGHEEVVYIRNNDLMTDYELVANEDTYTEVTGIQLRG